MILLFLRPLLDLDWSPFRLIVPAFLGLVELSTLFKLFSRSFIKNSSSAYVLIPSKKECINACLAVSLSAGSIINSPFIMSTPSFESFPAYFLAIISGLVTSGNLNPIKRGFLANCSCWKGVRAPSIFYISNSWSISDSPGNNGSPSVSSPIMQPIAQISTSLEYLSLSRSSGLLYHLVAT